MPKDAAPNGDAPTSDLHRPWARVSGMQAKLHRWAAADPGRRFDDLFNLVHDPATLWVAWDRVASNQGARAAGSDGWTVARIEQDVGVPVFLDALRSSLKSAEFRPQPVRERKIPKPGGSGKVRRLGIPTVTDRVVQAALKLVLEPIFEADFEPVSYGFRPERRAQDAITEIHHFGTVGYRWVLDADIEACFDRIDHTALMERVRLRVKDKRVLRLVKAFLKAGVLTELGKYEDTDAGTPQGGILSPLLANIALSVLDEHMTRRWKPGEDMSTTWKRNKRVRAGLPVPRLVRYADDFVVLARGGTPENMHALRQEITQVLAPMGLTLSEAKTQVTHMSDGFDFLGFHIQWKRKRGTSKWYVYTFIGKRPLDAVKAKIRALTRRTSQQDLKDVLIRLNQITRGWVNYFKHASAKRVFHRLRHFTWWRVIRMMRARHRWKWKDVRRWLTDHTGRWRPITADGITMFHADSVPVTRHLYRGAKIPTPWSSA
ncbi:group II intron reverse transcriptase/maturase [Myceligenerans halotolerans]